MCKFKDRQGCAIEKPTKNGFLKRIKEIIFFSLHIRKARGRSCRNPNWILKRTILTYSTPGVCYFCFLGGVLITMGPFNTWKILQCQYILFIANIRIFRFSVFSLKKYKKFIEFLRFRKISAFFSVFPLFCPFSAFQSRKSGYFF